MAPQGRHDEVNGWRCTGIRAGQGEWHAAEGNAVLLYAEDGSNAWKRITLTFTVELMGGHAWVDLDPWYILFNPDEGRITASRYVHGNIFDARHVTFDQGRPLTIGIAVEQGRCIVTLNGEMHSFNAEEDEPATRAVRVSFTNGVKFSMPTIEIRQSEKETAMRPVQMARPALEMTVDFFDDMMVTPYDMAKLQRMFEQIASMGIRKTYWIHHGERASGFWDSVPMPAAVENFRRTFDVLGNDYLPAAVKAAHRVENELVAILKPFDTAICHVTQSEEPDASSPVVGGWLKWAFDFPRRHPELCMQRLPNSGDANSADARIATVGIHSHAVLPDISRDDVQVWTSERNARYEPASFDLKVEGHTIFIRLQAADAPYVLVHFADRLARLIRNTADQIVRACDRQGNEVACTPGLFIRRKREELYHLNRDWVKLDPVIHGMNYDYAGDDIPSAVWNSSGVRHRLYWPAKADGFIGIAAGVNAHVPAVLSEAMPETHAWWLQQIDEMLASGADGVEIRAMNHGNILDWRMYGFNAPLLKSYQERYGRLPTREDFADVQVLRGGFFTNFLRAASRRVRVAGKKFYLHIEDVYRGSAGEPAPMGIHLPWRTWLDENLCDGVTLKPLNHCALSSGWATEVISACRQRGIPVSFCPFIHSLYNDPHREHILRDIFSLPVQALNLYEFATLYKFVPDGEMVSIDQLPEWIIDAFSR